MLTSVVRAGLVPRAADLAPNGTLGGSNYGAVALMKKQNWPQPDPIMPQLASLHLLCCAALQNVAETCAVMRPRRKTFSTSVSLRRETTSASARQPKEMSCCFAVTVRLITCGCWKGLQSEPPAALLKLFYSLIQSLSCFCFC